MNGESKPMFAETESSTTSAQRDKQELLKRALEEFCARSDAGEEVHRESFLQKYAIVADELAECFVSLDFVRHIAPQLADDEPQTASESPTIRPKASLGDFRILRQLGRGGMGVVFEAEQLSLGRVVALKVLPFASMLDEKQLQRFKNEARAAATLDHPNIISVYGTGQDRGVHYYAMQLIHGQNIAQVIDDLRRTAEPREASDPISPAGDTQPQAALSTERSNNPVEFFRSIAKLGMQAAQALDHAHAQGIVHRDVKPANLMLDDRGKVYVTDFGLARIETDAGVTMTGDLVGTLRYMSPEQALAKRVVVDHRTDVYSLGVTLYELLTLKPAFAGDNRQQLLHNISFEEPKPPRSISRAIPTELDTIIRKSIEKNPGDRYATASELADDLRRFLEDKPIHAKPPSLWQRTAKWSRRHKPIVASAAVILLLATIGLAIGSLLLARERNVAENARESAQRQQEEAERQRDEANWQREEAERQKTLAEDNFRRARDAVDAYLTSVSENQLLNTPSLQPLRKDLLELALKYYREFIAERSDDVALQADLATAFYRVGRITSEIGSKEEALKAHTNALAIRIQLAARNPENADIQIDMAEDHRSVGVLQTELGAVDEAGTSLREAIVVSSAMSRQHPAINQYQLVLANSYFDLGMLQKAVGEDGASSDSFASAIRIHEKLADAHPNDLNYQVALASSYNSLGLNQVNVGDQDAGLQSVQKAVEIMQTLVETNPRALEYQASLAAFHTNVGTIRDKASDLDGAIASFQSAIETQEKLARENPEVSGYREALANSYRHLGSVQAQSGQEYEQVQSRKRATEILGELVKERPDAPAYQDMLASSLDRLGEAYQDIGDLPRAESVYKEAVTIRTRLVHEHPKLRKYQEGLAAVYNNFARILSIAGKRNEAIASWKMSEDINKSLMDEYPDVLSYRDHLAITLTNLASNVPDKDKAISYCLRALELRERLVQENGDVSRLQAHLAGCLDTLAWLQAEAGKPDDAVASLLRAIDICQTLVAENPGVRDFQHSHFATILDICFTAPDSDRLDEAAAVYQKSLNVVEKLAREHPNAISSRAPLDSFREIVKAAKRNASKYEVAITAYRCAIGVAAACLHEHPERPEFRSDLERFVEELGALLSKLDRHDEAADMYRQVLDEQVRLVRRFPKSQVNAGLSEFRGGLVSALLKDERPQDVKEFFQEQVSTWKQLESECQDKVGCLLQRADLHHRFADWLMATNQASEAESQARMAIESARTAVQTTPHSTTSSNDWSRLARLLDQIQHGGTLSDIDAAEAKEIRENVEQLIRGSVGRARHEESGPASNCK